MTIERAAADDRSGRHIGRVVVGVTAFAVAVLVATPLVWLIVRILLNVGNIWTVVLFFGALVVVGGYGFFGDRLVEMLRQSRYEHATRPTAHRGEVVRRRRPVAVSRSTIPGLETPAEEDMSRGEIASPRLERRRWKRLAAWATIISTAFAGDRLIVLVRRLYRKRMADAVGPHTHTARRTSDWWVRLAALAAALVSAIAFRRRGGGD
jgi:hypothetical protein